MIPTTIHLESEAAVREVVGRPGTWFVNHHPHWIPQTLKVHSTASLAVLTFGYPALLSRERTMEWSDLRGLDRSLGPARALLGRRSRVLFELRRPLDHRVEPADCLAALAGACNLPWVRNHYRVLEHLLRGLSDYLRPVAPQ